MIELLNREARDALERFIDDRVAERLAEAAMSPSYSSPWMTVPEAAEYLRTTEGAIRKRIQRGQLHKYRPHGSQILLRREELGLGAGPPSPAVL
jgi:excisionase family DNA binding protein